MRPLLNFSGLWGPSPSLDETQMKTRLPGWIDLSSIWTQPWSSPHIKKKRAQDPIWMFTVFRPKIPHVRTHDFASSSIPINKHQLNHRTDQTISSLHSSEKTEIEPQTAIDSILWFQLELANWSIIAIHIWSMDLQLLVCSSLFILHGRWEWRCYPHGSILDWVWRYPLIFYMTRLQAIRREFGNVKKEIWNNNISLSNLQDCSSQ